MNNWQWLKLLTTLGITALGLKTVSDNNTFESNHIKEEKSKDKPNINNTDISATLFRDVSMCVNMYTQSVKEKNPYMFKKCVVPKLFESLQNTMKTDVFNTYLLEYFFYQHLKRVVRTIFNLDSDDLVDVNKFQYIRVVKVCMFKKWLAEFVPEMLDMPLNMLSIEEDYNNVAIAEGSFFYDGELKIVTILFVYNHDVHRWQLSTISKETILELKSIFENDLLLFYSNNCRSVLEKNVLENLDENNIFQKYVVDGILSCDSEHTNLISIGLSMEKLEKVSKKIRYEMNMVAKTLQQKSCIWFLKYTSGVPVQMYMAHNERSQFVGGYDFASKQLIKNKIDGGIWSLLN